MGYGKINRVTIRPIAQRLWPFACATRRLARRKFACYDARQLHPGKHVRQATGKNLRAEAGRRPVVPGVGREGLFSCAPRPSRRTLYHRHPSAERHRLAPHRPRAEQHPPGHPDPLAANAGPQCPVGSGHGPCRHRHAKRRGAPIDGRGFLARATGPGQIRRAGLGVEGSVRRHDHPATQAARRVMRLVPRALHDGRGLVESRPRGLRQAP